MAANVQEFQPAHEVRKITLNGEQDFYDPFFGLINGAGADSPSNSSNASTHVPHSATSSPEPRERTRSPQSRERTGSMDSLSSLYDMGGAGPATYNPEDYAQSHHRHFPMLTIGKGPGHMWLQPKSPSPGPGDFFGDDRVLAHRHSMSGVTIPRGLGHQWSRKDEIASPGPTSYNPDDKLKAHHRHFPTATFGRSAGHDLSLTASSSPGIAHCADDRVLAHRKSSSGVTIGRGPGHQTTSLNPQTSPGPASYDADDKLLAGRRSYPSSTIGQGPGHDSSCVRNNEPAPGSYNLARSTGFDSRHKGPRAASLSGPGRERASAEELLRFKRADSNFDGTLDLNEIESLMKGRFTDIEHGQVRAIFKLADRNNDGKIDFQELFDYTHGSGPQTRRLREKLLMALAAPGQKPSYREGEERMHFRRADLNQDGNLDVHEVEALMTRWQHDIKRRDVRAIFQGADRNHDGKLDFMEVVDYLHSRKVPSQRRFREKLSAALAQPLPAKMKGCQSHPTLLPCSSNPSGSSSKQTTPSNSCICRSSSASTVGSLVAGRGNTP